MRFRLRKGAPQRREFSCYQHVGFILAGPADSGNRVPFAALGSGPAVEFNGMLSVLLIRHKCRVIELIKSIFMWHIGARSADTRAAATNRIPEVEMSETKRDYEIGYGKPPRGRPFQKGQSGNPRGPRRKDLSSLLIAALNEPVYATIDGKRRKITKRQAIITQMVNESASANLRATKMLFDMIKEVEQKAGAVASPEPAKLTASDREVVELFVARLRRQIAAEAAEVAEVAEVAAAAADEQTG
jgi:hypothetical protein